MSEVAPVFLQYKETKKKERKSPCRCVVLYTVKINVAESPEEKKEAFCVSRKRVCMYIVSILFPFRRI